MGSCTLYGVNTCRCPAGAPACDHGSLCTLPADCARGHLHAAADRRREGRARGCAPGILVGCAWALDEAQLAPSIHPMCILSFIRSFWARPARMAWSRSCSRRHHARRATAIPTSIRRCRDPAPARRHPALQPAHHAPGRRRPGLPSHLRRERCAAVCLRRSGCCLLSQFFSVIRFQLGFRGSAIMAGRRTSSHYAPHAAANSILCVQRSTRRGSWP